ncbi:MAG: helix-turn-helix domain-containing protein [bacterium]
MIKNNRFKKQNSMNKQRTMTTSETMECLQTSKPALLKMVHQGKIRANKAGREYRFLKSELDRFLLGEIEPLNAASK